VTEGGVKHLVVLSNKKMQMQMQMQYSTGEAAACISFPDLPVRPFPSCGGTQTKRNTFVSHPAYNLIHLIL